MSALENMPEPGKLVANEIEPAAMASDGERGAMSRIKNTIDLRQNRAGAIMTLLFVAAIAVVFLALWLGKFAKTETARGIISAAGGFSRLDAPRAGVLTDIYVRQGDNVEVGQPIYMLRIGEIGSGGESAVAAEMRTSLQTRVNLVAEVERARALIEVTRAQQGVLASDQAALMTALDNQEKSVDSALMQARDKVKRVRDLVQRGYATRDLLDTHERAYFDYERQLTEVKLKRAEYRRADNEKQREMTVLLADKESQRANAENQINTIDGQVGRLKTESALQVQAQAAGQLLAITSKIGDSVEAGQFVAAIGDANAEPLIVLDVPARATGLIKTGQRVILKYDAFPFKTFGIQHGTVTSISSAAIRSPTSQGDSAMDARPMERQSLYRIEVKPDSDEIEAYGEKKKLKIGSTLSADIIVEKRRLIDWVLDPIRAMRGRV